MSYDPGDEMNNKIPCTSVFLSEIAYYYTIWNNIQATWRLFKVNVSFIFFKFYIKMTAD